jgi:DNA-binding transcriptional regulator YhcF (GntR family)
MAVAPRDRRRPGKTVPLRAQSQPPSLKGQPPVWQVLKQYIEERISIGTYPVGSWLPSVRELAAELRVNRNTVSKVYQALAREGILTTVHGAGVRVERQAMQSGIAEPRLTQGIEALVHEARYAGVDPEVLVSRVAQAVRDAYGGGTLRIGFIECSLRDSQTVAEDLSRHVGLAITPILLDDLLADPQPFGRAYDLLCTTFFHFQEVVDRVASPPEIVPIHHMPSHRSILEVASLPRGVTVGIVCPNQRTLDRVEGMVRTYIQASILPCTVDDHAALKKIASQADVIVDTVTSHEAVREYAPKATTITVLFHIERQSIEYLQAKISEMKRRIEGSTPGTRPALISMRTGRATRPGTEPVG